MHTLTKRR